MYSSRTLFSQKKVMNTTDTWQSHRFASKYQTHDIFITLNLCLKDNMMHVLKINKYCDKETLKNDKTVFLVTQVYEYEYNQKPLTSSAS